MQATYSDVLRPVRGRGAAAYDLGVVFAGSAIIALSAQVSFRLPWSMVPITGQTLGVLLTGALLGSKLGLAAVAMYLLEGAFGLPVFAGAASGTAYMLGPTGGYLAAFLPAAWLVGLLAQRGWDRSALTAVAAMLLGNAMIYAGGMAWLSLLIGPKAAVLTGLVPFVIGDVVKIVLAALTLPVGWKLLRKFAESES